MRSTGTVLNPGPASIRRTRIRRLGPRLAHRHLYRRGGHPRGMTDRGCPALIWDTPGSSVRSRHASFRASSVTVPPAAAIFSLAEPETASTVTCSATETSPVPSTLTSSFLRTAPLATRSATVTSPPSRVELGQLVQVDDLELARNGVLEALELRETHVEGHLPALEALRNLVAGLGALGTTTGRLALGRLTTTHTGLGGLGARGGTQVVELQRVVIRHVSRPPRP